MSHIYRIGDRVRIVYSVNYPELNGTQGTVVSNPELFTEDSSGFLMYGMEIHTDFYGSSMMPDNFQFWATHDQLEPILPKSLPAEIIAMKGLPDCDVADLLRKHEREGVNA